MLSPLTQAIVVDNHQRQADAEGGALTFALARRLDRATMHLHDVAHNREPEPDARRRPLESGVRLAKPLEYMGQELATNPHACIADHDLNVRIDALDAHLAHALSWA
jgi:hypothetical protein